MKYGWKLVKVLFVISVVANFVIAGRTFSYNRSVKNSFEYSCDSGPRAQYREKTPVHKMQLQAYWNFFVEPMVGIEKVTFELPCDVEYYTVDDHDVKILAKTIAAGTEVRAQVREESMDMIAQYGYGVWGFPTYDRGWRYAQPFCPVDAKKDSNFYYVITEDLEQAALCMAQSENAYRQPDQTEAEAVEAMVLAIDRELYAEGLWCSPSLLKPAWSLWNTAASVVMLLTGVIWMRAALRKRKASLMAGTSRPMSFIKKVGILLVILVFVGVFSYLVVADIGNVIAIEIAGLILGVFGIALYASFNQSTNVLPPKGPIEGRTFFGK